MLNNIKPHIPADLYAKIEPHVATFEALPCVVIIHDLSSGSVVYMSQRGVDLLGTSIAEIASMPHEEYHNKYFNSDDAKDYAPKILGLLERNSDEEMITHFQQVRFAGSDEWHWHLSSAKVFHRDDDGKARLALALAIPVDAMHHMTAKAERLLQENNFLRENSKKFSTLTPREKEVLTLTALGNTAAEVADRLFISPATAETHRRNINNKLKLNSSFDLQQYARAFDLI